MSPLENAVRETESWYPVATLLFTVTGTATAGEVAPSDRLPKLTDGAAVTVRICVVASSTEALPPLAFAVTRSGATSPVSSPTATEAGVLAAAQDSGARRGPLALPRSTPTRCPRA